MRPIASDQDWIRHPLNDLLGTRANVRLLRLLSEEISGPVSAPEAADQTGLTEAGARRALKRLVRTGFVEQLGGGRSQQFRLREHDPISTKLAELFRAERERHQGLLAEFRGVLGGIPEVEVAWIENFPTGVGQPLHVGVLAGSASLSYLPEEIRRRIVDLEGRYDLTIELHAYSRADVPEVQWDRAVLLAGSPEASGTTTPPPPHSARVERSRRISGAIAEMLDADPSLIRRAERHLEFLIERGEGTADHDLREWRDILAHYSKQRLKDFLVSESPRARRLRQSSPFFAVLDSGEREALLDSLEDDG